MLVDMNYYVGYDSLTINPDTTKSVTKTETTEASDFGNVIAVTFTQAPTIYNSQLITSGFPDCDIRVFIEADGMRVAHNIPVTKFFRQGDYWHPVIIEPATKVQIKIEMVNSIPSGTYPDLVFTPLFMYERHHMGHLKMAKIGC